MERNLCYHSTTFVIFQKDKFGNLEGFKLFMASQVGGLRPSFERLNKLINIIVIMFRLFLFENCFSDIDNSTMTQENYPKAPSGS